MTREEAAMSELDAARERYKRHLAAIENTGYGYYLSDTERMHDMQLLARAACDGLGEGSDQFLKQLLREARVHWYHDLSIPSAAALELKLIVDAAIDAAREAQS